MDVSTERKKLWRMFTTKNCICVDALVLLDVLATMIFGGDFVLFIYMS